MSNHTASHRSPRKTLGTGKFRAVLALGTVLGIGTVLTLAAWTDSGVVNGTFSTGTVDIKLDGVDTLPVVTSLALSNAKPGDLTYAHLAITNVGSIAVNYTITPSITTASATTPLLESVLNVTVKVVPGATCDATTFAASSTSVIAERKLNVTTATTARPLVASSGVEHLCFKVELPSDAVSTVQGATTTASFTFTATQSS